MGVGIGIKQESAGIAMAVKEPQAPVNSASTLSAHMQTSQFIDDTMLSYGVVEIGEYCDGIAPALASNGLYGVVNENNVWVIKAMYDSIELEENAKVVAVLQGVEQILDIPDK